MKPNKIIFSLFCFITINIYAFDWFPIGAKWTWDYLACCTGDIYTNKWEIENDTIINNDTLQILNQYNTYFKTNTRIMVKEENKKAYRWYNNQLLLISDFTKQVQDTIQIVEPNFSHASVTLDTFIFIIDSIKPLLQNPLYVVQKGRISTKYGAIPQISPYFEIIERVIFYQFAFSEYFLSTEPAYPWLRCYQDDSLKLNFSTFDCDTVFTALHQRLNTNLPITVFPNPTSNKIQIQYKSSKQYKSASIMLLDVQGKIVYSNELINNTTFPTIDVSAFSNGMYFIKLTIDDEWITKSFIINH